MNPFKATKKQDETRRTNRESLTERERLELEPPPRYDCPVCSARPWEPCASWCR